jgi:hypothetical protein
MSYRVQKTTVDSPPLSPSRGQQALHRELAGQGPPGGPPSLAPFGTGPRVAVAYLINQYPKVSHSFIRREILALERAGHPVLRMALRGWDAETVDAADRDEQAGTRYLLQGGPLPLAWALVGWVWSAPGRLWRAVKLIASQRVV